MKKILITFFLVLSILASCWLSAFAWNSEFEDLSIEIQYKTTGVSLAVKGLSPAKYGQRLMVVVYKPAMNDGLTTQLRIARDPSSVEPLTTPSETEVIRLAEMKADKDGNFSDEWPLEAGIEDGEYIIVKVSGTGRTPVQASKLFYFESQEHFQSVTLRNFEDFTGEELSELLVEKKFLLGLTKDDSYYLDDKLSAMFAAIRDNDFAANPETGNLFNGSDDIITVLNRAEALQNLPINTTSADVSNLIRDYGYLMSYDFSKNNNDYTLMKEQAQSIVAGIFSEKRPICFTDVERVIEQSVGLAMMNSKDSVTIGPVVEKYATILGIDANDYKTYCDTYTSYEVNKAFVGRNFKKVSAVLTALNERVAVLAAGGDSTSDSTENNDNNSSGNNGGGGSSRPVSTVTTPIGTIQNKTEKEETSTGSESKADYTDVSDNHWAAKAVKALSAKNVINGFEDGTFQPNRGVTREQLIKMLVEAFDITGKSASISFADVSAERWSAVYIDAAAACGIVQGTNDGRFAPETVVTRQDAAVMLARLCDKKGIILSGNIKPTDSELIAEYAQDSVFRLAGAGVISGFEDGSFQPNEVLTRAQSAKLIYDLLNRYGV